MDLAIRQFFWLFSLAIVLLSAGHSEGQKVSDVLSTCLAVGMGALFSYKKMVPGSVPLLTGSTQWASMCVV